MAKTTKPNRRVKAMLETADGMRRIGIMDEATHAKITMRHLGDTAAVAAEPISGDDIRKLREDAHLSQAVFARSQPHDRLCVEAGARREAPDRPGAGAAQRDPAQRYRGDSVTRADSFAALS